MFASEILTEDGFIQIESNAFPYELWATADIAARNDSVEFVISTRAPRALYEGQDIELLNCGYNYPPTEVEKETARQWSMDVAEGGCMSLPLVFFRPDSLPASFSMMNVWTNQESVPLKRKRHRFKFLTDTPGQVRFYFPKWYDKGWADPQGKVMSTTTGCTFSNFQLVKPDDAKWGMVTRNEKGQITFDSRKYPLMFSRFKIIPHFPASSDTIGVGVPKVITYTPMGRVPWIMLNGLGGYYGNFELVIGNTNPSFAPFPKIIRLMEDGRLEHDSVSENIILGLI